MNAVLCDQCGTKTDPMEKYALTPPWRPIPPLPGHASSGSQYPRDFCSAVCLRSWLHAFEITTGREGDRR